MSSAWYETHPLAPALLLSPPGCGKTEELALWGQSLVTRGLVRPPQRILGLTFSNKAKANLRSRLHGLLGVGSHRYLMVTNFHGFAYHVFQHHSYAVGIDPLPHAPRRGWLASLLNDVATANYVSKDVVAGALRYAKVGPYDDDEVMSHLEEAAVSGALEYETRLRAAGERDHDDVLRLGLLTLEVDAVRCLYDAKFPALIVDEIQDLSLGHLKLALAVGGDCTVFAGDHAQGIFGFAGAEPAEVLSIIRSLDPVELSLDLSHRSSPAVLGAVSILNRALGGHSIQAANPESWEGKGGFEILAFEDHLTEANAVADLAMELLRGNQEHSIAIMARTGARRRWVNDAVRAHDMSAEIWDFPAHDPAVARLLQRHLSEIDTQDLGPVDALHGLARQDVEPSDLQTLDDLAAACESLRELHDEGYPIADVIEGIRITSSENNPVGPGLHLLNGHVGKGQQFDHVIVVGLEESFLPHYAAMRAEQEGDPSAITEELAVLHVMASRAKQTLRLAHAWQVPDSRGHLRGRTRSRFLTLFGD